MECFHCKKKTVSGRSHTHHRGVAGGRWKKRAPKTKRLFKPNLHKVMIMLNDKKQRVHLCSKCLKRVKKDVKDGKRPFLQLVAPLTKLKERSGVTPLVSA
ncbi:MAG: L28 family ribosomal protein [Patescibacteria group bacterium]